MRIANIVNDSIVDGPGLRFTVFVQGCKHNCKGCHNPSTHDINGGYEMSVEEIFEQIKKNPLIEGVTISGGEPLLQPRECVKLVMKCKEIGLNIWVYTGYTLEQLKDMPNAFSLEDVIKNLSITILLDSIDVLVDGPFILSKKSYDAKFRGSTNQRLIDMKATIKNKGKIVLWDSEDGLDKFKVPES